MNLYFSHTSSVGLEFSPSPSTFRCRPASYKRLLATFLQFFNQKTLHNLHNLKNIRVEIIHSSSIKSVKNFKNRNEFSNWIRNEYASSVAPRPIEGSNLSVGFDTERFNLNGLMPRLRDVQRRHSNQRNPVGFL